MISENRQPLTDNHQPKLKVCGLTKINQINELVEINIDFLGFIFYKKSPRFVLNHLSLEQISNINHQGKVGVFVNETVENIVEISEQAKLNFIQLHGDENDDFISELREKLKEKIGTIKVVRVGNETIYDLQKTLDSQLSTLNYLLFDTDSKAFGGTGKTFDWNILNNIEIPIPYFLSGGISLENIENLQNFVKVNLRENKTLTKFQPPFSLDINSKFEIEPGNKDLGKIKELISVVRT